VPRCPPSNCNLSVLQATGRRQGARWQGTHKHLTHATVRGTPHHARKGRPVSTRLSLGPSYSCSLPFKYFSCTLNPAPSGLDSLMTELAIPEARYTFYLLLSCFCEPRIRHAGEGQQSIFLRRFNTSSRAETDRQRHGCRETHKTRVYPSLKGIQTPGFKQRLPG